MECWNHVLSSFCLWSGEGSEQRECAMWLTQQGILMSYSAPGPVRLLLTGLAVRFWLVRFLPRSGECQWLGVAPARVYKLRVRHCTCHWFLFIWYHSWTRHRYNWIQYTVLWRLGRTKLRVRHRSMTWTSIPCREFHQFQRLLHSSSLEAGYLEALSWQVYCNTRKAAVVHRSNDRTLWLKIKIMLYGSDTVSVHLNGEVRISTRLSALGSCR